MEEIFKQYSAPIIIAIVIVALVAIVTLLLTTNGPVQAGFQTMITTFMTKANLGITPK